MLQALAYFSEILPIIFFLIFLKRNRGGGFWVVFLYSVLSVATEYVYIATKLRVVFSLFNILQFLLFSLFFFLSLKEKRLKYIPVIGAVIYFVFVVIKFTDPRFDFLSEAMAAVLLIPYCILLLYEQVKDPTLIFVYNDKKFWVIIAFFLYFSATLFLFIYNSTLSVEHGSNYWAINNLFEILKNILFCVAFIMKKRPNNPYTLETLDY